MTKPNANAGRPQEKANTKSNVTSIASARKPKSVGAEATTPAAEPSAAGEPATIVFGKDEAGKAHASFFVEADSELAIKAAAIMGFKVLRVTSPDIRAHALALPAGRIFASGKGFVPFTKMAVYEALNGFGEAFQPPLPEPTPAPIATGTPDRWTDIVVGSLVLATTEEPYEGWWESIVVEARGEGLFVLRWRDDPELEAFVRRADHLALLPAPAAETSADAQASA